MAGRIAWLVFIGSLALFVALTIAAMLERVTAAINAGLQ